MSGVDASIKQQFEMWGQRDQNFISTFKKCLKFLLNIFDPGLIMATITYNWVTSDQGMLSSLSFNYSLPHLCQQRNIPNKKHL